MWSHAYISTYSIAQCIYIYIHICIIYVWSYKYIHSLLLSLCFCPGWSSCPKPYWLLGCAPVGQKFLGTGVRSTTGLWNGIDCIGFDMFKRKGGNMSKMTSHICHADFFTRQRIIVRNFKTCHQGMSVGWRWWSWCAKVVHPLTDWI